MPELSHYCHLLIPCCRFCKLVFVKLCMSRCAAVGCCIHKQGKYSPVACAIIRAEMIITIQQDIRACVRALHRTCVVPVLHLNEVSRHQIWTLRGLILKHEADVVLMFPVPPQELKVTTEIMELRISWTSWKLGKSLTTVLWWISIFTQAWCPYSKMHLWNALPIDISGLFLSFPFE